MLLASSVTTPIHNSGFYLLARRVQCELGLKIFHTKCMQHQRNCSQICLLASSADLGLKQLPWATGPWCPGSRQLKTFPKQLSCCVGVPAGDNTLKQTLIGSFTVLSLFCRNTMTDKGRFTPETNWRTNWPNELMNSSMNWTNVLFPMGVSTPKLQFVPNSFRNQKIGFCGWFHTKLFAQFLDELIRLWCE